MSRINQRITQATWMLWIAMACCACQPSASNETGNPTDQPEPEGRFLNFSDIHFNPYFDTTLIDTLRNADYLEWEAIFESSTQQRVSSYHHDCNYPLLKSVLEKMKTLEASPDFIMISGDFLSHHFEPDFTRYARVPYQEDEAQQFKALHDFTSKTMKFLAHQIEQRFPGVPVWATLGNNDAYCGDYLIQPGASFLTMLSGVWGPMLHAEDKGTFMSTFPKAGYYAIPHPFNDKHKIIVLNSILFSINFNDPESRKAYCELGNYGPDSKTPGERQLTWLTAELDKSKLKGEKVWLMQHIPPGMNVFGTLPKDSTACVGDTSSYFLKPEFNDQYLAIVEEYADLITSNMAGHYHRDDFRLMKNAKGEAVSYMHILPSISPIYYNNPGFEIVTYNRESTELLDYTTYYTDVKSPVDSTAWGLEYNFRKTYGQSKMTAKTMDEIHKAMAKDQQLAKAYMTYYPVSESSSMKEFRFYWCGIDRLTPKEYAECVCNENWTRK